jgi:hypothetical protein
LNYTPDVVDSLRVSDFLSLVDWLDADQQNARKAGGQ